MPIPEQFRPERPGIPKWAIIVGLVVLAGGVYLVRRSNKSSSSVAPASSAVTPADTQQLPTQDTWPYNQLALPYNYTPATAQQVQNNVNYLDPQDPNYVGYQQGVIASGTA